MTASERDMPGSPPPACAGADMTRFPFTVALTGGIASGKSAAADRFSALGASVIDADLVARELVRPGTSALAEIVAAFGARALDAHGGLDRGAMRERVFADSEARRTLEAIVHPRVRDELHQRSALATGAYPLLVIPLLVESAHYAWVDRVVVVDVPRELQRTRLIERDRIAASLADAMLDAQASREQRLAIADDVIDNSGEPDALAAQVAALHAGYLQLASERRGCRAP